MISSQVDRTRQFTVFTVSGEVTGPELLHAVTTAHERGATPLSLWDVRGADIAHVSSVEVQAIVRTIAERGLAPKEAKAAVVASGEMEFIVGRICETVAQDEESPYTLAFFKDYEAALQWLGVPAQPG